MRTLAGFFFLIILSSLVLPLTGVYRGSSAQASSEWPLADARGLVGHNLLTTSYLIPAGRGMVGNYALGYGLSENFDLATSPWMIVNYNMPMVHLKASAPFEGAFERMSLEVNYFHSVPAGFNFYKQRSVMFRWTGSRRWDFYSMHLGMSLQHFWDDTRAFSLRLIPGVDERTTLSGGILHELDWGGGWGTFLETGFLGLNYLTPYAHLGLSVFRAFDWGYVQLGFSRSISLGDVEVYDKPTGYYWGAIHYSVLHPELQIAWIF